MDANVSEVDNYANIFNADMTYFACQAISSNPDLYENSDIGAMGEGHGSI